ncbi:MAG: UbiA family prenyltransferase [Thermoplasmata archaeon]|nr:UbiA family prenyltransferase [Thermoplasmata archaeon]
MSGPATSPSGWARELGRFLEIQNVGLNLPFGLAFLFAAAHGLPPWQTFLLVVIALLAARNAGHAFNRWTDRRLDALNPRTQDRALVTGRLSPGFALAVTALSAAVLVAAAALLNPLSLALSPVALVLVFGYSYTKRYTSFTTVFLGLVEALVPAGVFIAVTGGLPAVALVAVAAMLAWGTSFETIHSLGDLSTDRNLGLYSLPRRLGVRTSLALIGVLHAGALVLFGLFGALMRFGLPFWVAWAGMVTLVAYSDVALSRHPEQVRIPFERHFLLALLFLAGVLLALAFPGVQL